MSEVDYRLMYCDYQGFYLREITEFSHLSFSRAQNGVGTCAVTDPVGLDDVTIRHDMLLEVWRRVFGGAWMFEGIYFLLDWDLEDGEEDDRSDTFLGLDLMDLLQRRIILQVGVDEERTFTITGTGTSVSGHITMTFDGQTTGSIGWVTGGIAADDIGSALTGLSNVGSGNVAVTRTGAVGAGAWTLTYTIAFQNDLGNKPITDGGGTPLALTIADSLTGATPSSVTRSVPGVSATTTGKADDVMKTYVLNSLGAGGDPWGPNSVLRSLADNRFTIDRNLGKGQTITTRDENAVLLDALVGVAKANLEASPSATAQFFDLVVVDHNPLRFEFRTRTNADTANHTRGALRPIILSKRTGTLTRASLQYRYGAHKNYAIVAGKGNGARRKRVAVADTALIGASALSRREVFVDAGDTDDEAVMTKKGQEALQANKPIRQLVGTLANGPDFCYGRDIKLGDLCGAEFRGVAFDTRVQTVTVDVTGEGNEQVQVTLESNHDGFVYG